MKRRPLSQKSGVFLLLFVSFGLSSCSLFPISVDVTPAEVYANAGAWTGRRLTVLGKVEVISTACTLVGCPPDNPCCNRCSSRLGFRIDEWHSLELRGEGIGCGGDSCRQDCRPMQDGRVYRITGVLDGREVYYINVESWTMAG